MWKSKVAILAVLALAGCGSKPPENAVGGAVVNEEAAENAAIAANVALSATGKPVISPPEKPALVFPPAFLGRWAIAEADCDVSRQDNKGLLVVEPDRLRFYESRATLTAIADATQHKFTADLDFAGEGQEWKARESYELVAGNTAILRTTPSRETLRYKRC